MSFTSLGFIVAVSILCLIYYIIPKKFQWTVLLTGSVLFYMTYGAERILFILLASVTAYCAAVKIDKVYVKQDAYIKEKGLSGKEKQEYILQNKKTTKRILLLAVGFLVFMLAYSKMGNWLQKTVSGLIYGQEKPILPLIVALGISYYTFSLIAYLADVYWRKEKAEKNYLRFLLFVIYFPKILQGPISRHNFLAPQLKQEHCFDYQTFCFGVQLVVWGYFKKLVIADRLSIFVDTVFNDYSACSGAVLAVATIFGAVQLYCDFSGCMDIVRGVSQAFGIELEQNFKQPFFSRSAAEFWRRWHITLGAWFKDYVYMPIVVSPTLVQKLKPIKEKWGMKAVKKIMTAIPLAVVWILTGIWHGTGWPYIVWGIYWGGIIISSMLLESVYKNVLLKLGINEEAFWWRTFQMLRTFMLFCIARLLTMPNSLLATAVICKRIVCDFHVTSVLSNNLFQYGLDKQNFILVIIAVLIVWAVSVLQGKGMVREMVARRNIVLRWSIYFALIFAVIIFGIYGPGYDASSFIYEAF